MRGILWTFALVTAMTMGMLLQGARCEEEEEEPGLEVSVPQVALEVHDSLNITCSAKEGTTLNETDKILWQFEDGRSITQLNSSKVKEEDGTLIFVDVDESLKGEYSCTTTHNTYSMTVLVKVYQMPSYFTEGMILLGINGALILIFISCAVVRFVQTRRERTSSAKKRNRRPARV